MELKNKTCNMFVKWILKYWSARRPPDVNRVNPYQQLKQKKTIFFYVLSFQIRLDLAGKGTCKKNGYFMVRLTIRVGGRERRF